LERNTQITHPARQQQIDTRVNHDDNDINSKASQQ
jgi:hypothetical protein